MNRTELRNNNDLVREVLIEEFGKIFTVQEKNGCCIFTNSHGVGFELCQMGRKAPWSFFVIEYKYTFEDGDAFYPEDYGSLDDMVNAMKAEIEQS